MFAQHSRAARLHTRRNDSGQPVAADKKLTHALHESAITKGHNGARQWQGRPAAALHADWATDWVNASVNRKLRPIPATIQGPMVQEATRSQGLTSRDATSIQGPTLKGRAAANRTKREQVASSRCNTANYLG